MTDEPPPEVVIATTADLDQIILAFKLLLGQLVVSLRAHDRITAIDLGDALESASRALAIESQPGENRVAAAIIEDFSRFVRESLTNLASHRSGPMGEA